MSPAGIQTDSSSIGANSPPHVVSLDQTLTYLNSRSLFETRPYPSMYISREDSTSPGLEAVVQVTLVVVAAETGQSIPSMVMLYLVVSAEKSVPVKVATVPPTTVPNLGLMESRAAVSDPW